MAFINIVMKGNDIQYVEAPKGMEIAIVDKESGISFELHENNKKPSGMVKYK